jgi:hypothetical protein
LACWIGILGLSSAASADIIKHVATIKAKKKSNGKRMVNLVFIESPPFIFLYYS